jgi:hypothetical protein
MTKAYFLADTNLQTEIKKAGSGYFTYQVPNESYADRRMGRVKKSKIWWHRSIVTDAEYWVCVFQRTD